MVYKWMLMAKARVNSWRDWVVIALSTWPSMWSASMDDCISTILHADVREGLMQFMVRIVAWIIFSLSDHSSPTLHLLCLNCCKLSMNDFELKTHRIFLFYFNSLTKWACVKQVGSSCIWSNLVWPNRLHGFFSFLWKSIKSSRNSNNKSSGDCPMSSMCSRISWLGTPGAPPCCD